jgi:hypothetical protein
LQILANLKILNRASLIPGLIAIERRRLRFEDKLRLIILPRLTPRYPAGEVFGNSLANPQTKTRWPDPLYISYQVWIVCVVDKGGNSVTVSMIVAGSSAQPVRIAVRRFLIRWTSLVRFAVGGQMTLPATRLSSNGIFRERLMKFL